MILIIFNLNKNQIKFRIFIVYLIVLTLFQDLVDNVMEEYLELRLFVVEEVICKLGNK